MEYGLGEKSPCQTGGWLILVLILIVVEYGLGDGLSLLLPRVTVSLNPYCSGIWSRRDTYKVVLSDGSEVLILIVVEYGLGGL